MFYEYLQNNSGGGFDFSVSRGITHHVIIEADSADDANAKAERIGLYFDGEGDCHCCGARWWAAYDGDGDDVPSIYGKPIEEHTPWTYWMNGKPEAYVHYADGRIVGMIHKPHLDK